MTEPSAIESLKEALLSYPAVNSVFDTRDKPTSWMLDIELKRSERGWQTLEWFAWAINSDWREKHKDTLLFPKAAYPPLNENSLYFILGGSSNAFELASFLNEQRTEEPKQEEQQ